MQVENEKARVIFENIKKNGSTVSTISGSSVATMLFDGMLQKQSPTAQFTSTIRMPNLKQSAEKSKEVRNSHSFVKNLSFYSFMQGFFIKSRARVVENSSTRGKDFYQACTNVVNISGALFDSIPGSISDDKAYQTYKALREFQDTHIIGNSYTAVLNFFLGMCIRIQEDVVIKDKKKTDMLQRLVDNLTFIIDVAEIEHTAFYKSNLLEKNIKKKRKLNIDSLAEQAKDKHVAQELDKVKAMTKHFDKLFSDMEYAAMTEENISEQEKLVMLSYKKFIADNPDDWKEKVTTKFSEI